MGNNELVKTLAAIGLSDKEAAVYIAGLQGTASVPELARRAQIKRPTAYVVVDALAQQGILLPAKSGQKELYRSIAPQELQKRFERTLEAYTGIVPALTQMVATQPGRPKVEVFDTKDGIMRVYDEMFKEKKVKSMFGFDMISAMFPEVDKEFERRLFAGEIASKDIVDDSPSSRAYARRLKHLPNWEGRIAKGHQLQSDYILYADTVVFVSLKQDNLFVVKIENPDIAHSMNVLFDLAWEKGKKVK